MSSMTSTRRRLRVPSLSPMQRAVWRSFWTSRLLVMLVGMAAVPNFGIAPGTAGLDPEGLTRPFGYFGNLLVAPLARWDSVWYLTIAKHGYQAHEPRMAFFPLYPDLIRVLGWVVGSQLIAGVLISAVCFLVALWLLHRLVCLDFSEEVAETAVLLLAFCPVSFFFSAVYTESLFLMLSLGTVYAARRGHWLTAGVLGGLAAASRGGGVLLLAPVVILLFYGPREQAVQWVWSAAATGGRRLRRLRWLLPRYRPPLEATAVLLIPLGLLIYLLYLRATYGTFLAPFRVEKFWYHKTTWPFGGAWQGLVAAWDGIRQLVHGPPPPVYFRPNGGPPMVGSAQDIELFGFLVLGFAGLIGMARRLPVAYTVYTLLGLALPLTDPVTPQPLLSLPRYEMVLFPLFIWGAELVVRRRWTAPALAASATMLGFLTAMFATWRFVA